MAEQALTKIFNTDKLKYIIPATFIILNAICIAHELYFFMLVPFLLLIVFISLVAIDKLVLLCFFLIPLSIPLNEITKQFSFDFSLPAEPLIFLVLVIFIFKLIKEQKFDFKIIKHPISIAILINLSWMIITSITSTMPIVSTKFTLARVWFLVAFYFIATKIFENYSNIKRSIWLYIIPLIAVIIYTIIRHITYGIFDKQVAHWVMSPFYNDHTAYAAILAMYFPLLIGFCLKSNYSINMKFIIWCLTVFFTIAIVLSYTRAAWVSLVGILGVWMVIKLRINKYLFIGSSVIITTIFMIYSTEIFMTLERNRQDSSADFAEHVKSISNIATDASNLERINRWKSAFRMFDEKPIFGWGPGTYQFNYAPFQFSYERTIISTNAGNGGNAHSEYIGPLAESGLLGSLTFIAIILTTIVVGLKLYFRTNDKEIKMLVMASLLGLITYYLHGFLNNFLDTDKASAPFWSFTAIIVALDIYHTKKSITNTEKQQQ